MPKLLNLNTPTRSDIGHKWRIKLFMFTNFTRSKNLTMIFPKRSNVYVCTQYLRFFSFTLLLQMYSHGVVTVELLRQGANILNRFRTLVLYAEEPT